MFYKCHFYNNIGINFFLTWLPDMYATVSTTNNIYIFIFLDRLRSFIVVSLVLTSQSWKTECKWICRFITIFSECQASLIRHAHFLLPYQITRVSEKTDLRVIILAIYCTPEFMEPHSQLLPSFRTNFAWQYMLTALFCQVLIWVL